MFQEGWANYEELILIRIGVRYSKGWRNNEVTE
jgi:hypothetical protein